MSLSRFLQTSSIDLKRATDAMKDTMSVLEQKRQEADTVFGQLISEAQELADKLDVELKAPRTVSRQNTGKFISQLRPLRSTSEEPHTFPCWTILCLI